MYDTGVFVYFQGPLPAILKSTVGDQLVQIIEKSRTIVRLPFGILLFFCHERNASASPMV
jgi:hypothetical protein